jgi:hypothetical protein
MRITHRIVTAFVVTMVALLAANIASAQVVDDRFDRFAAALKKDLGITLRMPTSAIPDVNTCLAQEYYAPSDFRLKAFGKYMPPATEVPLTEDACVVMTTTSGPRSALLAKGTIVGVGENGAILYVAVCINPVFGAIAMPRETPTVVEAPPLARQLAPRAPATSQVPRLRLVPSAPAQPEPTTQPVDEETQEEEAPPADSLVVSVGVGYTLGSDQTDYIYPNPGKGDVPKKNRYASPVLFARIDQSADHGVFVSAALTLCGSSSDMLFQDITGAWITKIRTTDNSCDKGYSFAGGYKFALGDVVHVGVSGNYDYWNFAQKYFAQNTNTVSERSFKTFGLGVEASGSTKNDNHKLTVSADGVIGIGGNRDNSTTQDYLGPPAITFPKVTDSQQSAKLNRIGGRVSIQAIGNLHGFADVHRSAWSSIRPDPFLGTENNASFALTFGGFYTWGNK